jgi:hypothetical protein
LAQVSKGVSARQSCDAPPILFATTTSSLPAAGA